MSEQRLKDGQVFSDHRKAIIMELCCLVLGEERKMPVKSGIWTAKK